MQRLIRLFLAVSLIALTTTAALATDANYVPWGVDEYEFFALSREQLATRFKGKVQFRDDMQRVLVSPQKGLCAGYDGPTFKLTFTDGRVSRVQRIFVGCKENQYGPTLDSKEAALRYAITGLSGFTAQSEKLKLQATRAELAALQKSRGH